MQKEQHYLKRSHVSNFDERPKFYLGLFYTKMKKFYQISELIKLSIEKILGTLSALLMIGVTLFALAEIFRRYILGVVFEWGQDAVIYATMLSLINI